MVDNLEKPLQKVATEAAEAQIKLDARNQAFTDWQENVPALVGLARYILKVAGDEEGSSRLRIVTNRATSTDDKEEPETTNTQLETPKETKPTTTPKA